MRPRSRPYAMRQRPRPKENCEAKARYFKDEAEARDVA